MQTISIVVPCYNEEGNIETTFETLSGVMNSIELKYEIIFVDNGGTDGQLGLMKNLYNKYPNIVRVVSLSRNFGYQMSISAGLEYATGDAVVMVDADLQDPPELIKQFVEKWQEGFDVVYGIREKRQGSFILRVFYKLFYWIFSKTADIPIPMNSGEFSLMSRRVVDEIRAMPERIRFIRGLRAWTGFQQVGIPYKRLRRAEGKSKFSLFDNFVLALDGILSFSTRILTFVSVMGFLIVLVSMLLLVYIVLGKFYSDIFVPGYAALMVTISFFSGVIIAMLGLIGASVERIFLEVKNRPKFIVKDTWGTDQFNKK
jgi:polyisoprenyl-phosphate glycosyltransferase